MTEAHQRIGLIVNSAAGGNPKRCFRAALQAVSALGVTRVVTGPGEFGADSVNDPCLQTEVCDIGDASGREGTRELARSFADLELDTVIVVGGDGTMADVAGVFLKMPFQPRILGIGAGSTNAGTLVTCLAEDAAQLDKTELVAKRLDALLVKVIGGPSAVAFNDCVFSSTVVGTLDGKLVDLDAAAMLDGHFKPGAQQSVGGADTVVQVIGQGRCEPLSCGPVVATIIIGFAEPEFRAKAITGGICLAHHVGFPAACLVADRPIAYFGATAESLLTDGPIRTAFMALDVSGTVVITGLNNGAVVCVDGNPLASLNEESEVQIQPKPGVITALKMQEKDK